MKKHAHCSGNYRLLEEFTVGQWRACSLAVPLHYCPSLSGQTESGNKAPGSGWLGGKKRSPLQMLYDLDQGSSSALAEVHRQRRNLLRLFQDISPFYQRRLFDLYKMDFLLFNYSAPSYLRLH
ncbi:PREDICTED: carbohydrate sulfotransferase 13 [Myotis brandtii]|uniref:carbohydrate sulfotransferase 13 n=1 Tax=Myotis brandtii TaxID=109478 RepID=UPI000703DA08|nr:PREDICTED: carbohydrate sulfotransferase 13 [Myotis brandtii]